jgi:hypothetical protein
MDSFSDLIRTAADVRLGVEATYALLAGEPAGAILFVSRLGAQVDLRRVSFSAISVAMTRFIDGNLRWHGSVSSGDFVDAIVDMAQMVEQEYGRSEFERRWGHAFPAQRLAKFR